MRRDFVIIILLLLALVIATYVYNNKYRLGLVDPRFAVNDCIVASIGSTPFEEFRYFFKVAEINKDRYVVYRIFPGFKIDEDLRYYSVEKVDQDFKPVRCELLLPPLY